MTIKRGALIVVEGLDRTGKSTQCKTLVDNLNKTSIKAIYTNFPARNTEIGKVVDNYLMSKNELSDEAIHLLFSANRWERARNIIETLEKGISVVVDRYCYSGVAFSAAKGLDLKWCKSCDAGLPQPDKVFFLTVPMETIKQRNGFGKERYEVLSFQEKVSNIYMEIKDESWEILDASRSIEEIQKELLQKTEEIVTNVHSKPVCKIWQE